MRPAYRISAAGADITDLVRKRLVSASLTDEAGMTADRFSLTLDDRDQAVPMPLLGKELTVHLGYDAPGATAPLPMGRFTIDNLTVSHPPATVSVQATAADLMGAFREPRTRSWHQKTVAEICTTIAADHGFIPRVDGGLGAILLGHVDQDTQSDAAFLTRLAEDMDALMKVGDGKLLFMPKAGGQTANGFPLPVLPLSAGDVTRWSISVAERQRYNAAVAHWQDHAEGEAVAVTVGDGTPVLRLEMVYASAEQARRAAEARLNAARRSTATLSLTLPGDPRAAAETLLSLDSFHPALDTVWRVVRAEHRFDNSGYVTSVSAEAATGAPWPGEGG